jgi:tetratricopeptide (TPR) repeat protein
MNFPRKATLTAALIAASLCTQAQTLIEKADKQYELHAYRLAAKSYESIYARDPEELGIVLKLADCYFHLNEADNAARYFQKAVADPKVRVEAHLNYGKVLMMMGRYEEAEKQFREFKRADATVAENYIKSCQFARENERDEPDMKVTPLYSVNTPTSDFGISMFKEQILWSSSRDDIARSKGENVKNVWSGATANQMFTAPIEGVSEKPFSVKFLKSDLKNTWNESHASYSADGKTVAFMRNNLDDGERITSNGGMEFSLYLADVDSEGNWKDVKAFAHNGSGYSTGFPSLSPDGKTLYFASNRPGGMGGFDIYACQKRSLMWAEPRNLGAAVNTQGDEITPFMDGKTLYFASDFQTGYGGFDIFKTDNNFDVINMGTSINTSGDDYGFVFDPTLKLGYFVSTRKGGKGKEDIYRVEKAGEMAQIIILDDKKELLKDAKVSVSQGDPLSLRQVRNNYILDLNNGKSYTIDIKKDGFKAKSLKLDKTYDNKTRIVEVVLERDIPTAMSTIPDYQGTVIDGTTGKPIEGVLVKATNQNTPQQLEMVSDASGKYKFPLSPKASYLITYSKEGFVIGKRTANLSEVRSKGFGDFVMKPSAVTDKTEFVVKPTANAQNTEGPSKIPTEYDVKVKPTVKAPETPHFAVQLLVSTSDDVLNLSKYDELKNLGNLYISTEEGKQKVRLGVYPNKEEANAAYKKAAVLGFKGTYVVEEKNGKAATNNIFKKLPKALPKPVSVKGEEETDNSPAPTPKVNAPKPLPTPKSVKDVKDVKETPASNLPKPLPKSKVVTPKTTEKGSSKTAVKSDIPTSMNTVVKPKTTSKSVETPAPVVEMKPVVIDKTFKVQIAAMKKPEWFDDSKVSKLWKIEQVKEGKLTYFIMDGIKTLEQAKDLKAKVKTAGYKDAKVVIKEEGKFKIVD